MSTEYYPSNPDQFSAWLSHFVTVLTINAPQVGIVAADVAPLEADSDEFATALGNYNTKKFELTSASGAKQTKMDEAIATLRPLVRRIQNHPGMDNALRGMLGLPLHGTAMVTAGIMPPDVPGIYLETEPGTVFVHFGTEPGNEKINGKPAGVKGCNIWRQKAGETGYTLVAYQSASPYKDTIQGAGVDYTYVVQYRGNKASDTGQMSAPSTIAARGGLVEQAA